MCSPLPGKRWTAPSALAEQIGENSPVAVRETLRPIAEAVVGDEKTERDVNEKARATVFSSDDVRGGPRALLERRAPRWSSE